MNTAYSDYSPVISGIPWGGILGPLLFVIFINDLPDCIEILCKIFADDTKTYGPSKKYSVIQDDLLKLMEWSKKWQLFFNTVKCSVLHSSKDNDKKLNTIQI